MTQTNESIRKLAEFNALFLTLNEKGQDAALTVLQSLSFAQSLSVGNVDKSVTEDDILFREINYLLRRNRNERYLRAVLTRARILESLIR